MRKADMANRMNYKLVRSAFREYVVYFCSLPLQLRDFGNSSRKNLSICCWSISVTLLGSVVIFLVFDVNLSFSVAKVSPMRWVVRIVLAAGLPVFVASGDPSGRQDASLSEHISVAPNALRKLYYSSTRLPQA
uniref:Uncharacterized protein n=1 Tax=Glossina pallidipes TaxID=7398 RepID=A0A1B0A2Q9_GLOPL